MSIEPEQLFELWWFYKNDRNLLIVPGVKICQRLPGTTRNPERTRQASRDPDPEHLF